jgi:hypothetical protein
LDFGGWIHFCVLGAWITEDCERNMEEGEGFADGMPEGSS